MIALFIKRHCERWPHVRWPLPSPLLLSAFLRVSFRGIVSLMKELTSSLQRIAFCHLIVRAWVILLFYEDHYTSSSVVGREQQRCSWQRITATNQATIPVTPLIPSGDVIAQRTSNIKGITVSFSRLRARWVRELTLWNGLDLRPIKNELLEMSADPHELDASDLIRPVPHSAPASSWRTGPPDTLPEREKTQRAAGCNGLRITSPQDKWHVWDILYMSLYVLFFVSAWIDLVSMSVCV